MKHRRVRAVALLALCGLLALSGYRAVHQSNLDHELIVACSKNQLIEVRSALARGANPNAQEYNGSGTGFSHLLRLFHHRPGSGIAIRPLSAAAVSGSSKFVRYDMLKLLLERGANPNIKLGG